MYNKSRNKLLVLLVLVLMLVMPLAALAQATTPSVTVEDQPIEDGQVTVASVVSDGPGWIVIHAEAEGGPGPVIGFSPVEDGENTDVVVEVDEAQATETLYAMLHTDAGTEGEYEFPGDDTPVSVDGQVVTPSFTVASMAAEATAEPTGEPTEEAMAEPTGEPTGEPTEEATAEPTEEAMMEEGEEEVALTVACEEDYSVQADDWLSKIADKFYGDVLAYPAIVDATNVASAAGNYNFIDNPDIIEPGWTLCIPSAEDAQRLLSGEITAEAMMEAGAMMEEDAMAESAMEEGAEEAAMAEAEGPNYVLVPKNLGNPYFDTANQGAQEAAEELGANVTYQGSATADPTEQIQLLNSLIAQQVNGLAVSANDADALSPVGSEAISAGIPVVSWDAEIAPDGRTVHVLQAIAEDIGRGQVQLMSDLIGGEGQIAVLSATSTAPNQNEWIKWMEEELTKPEYENMELVSIVYGDDEDEKSYNEAQGLMRTYPDLKGIISPTTVGVAAAARAVEDADKVGEVIVTGLGTPNQMREYVKSGSAPAFMLWNPADLGYLAIYTLDAIASGQIEGNPGDSFEAGRLGSYTVDEEGVVLLGPPTVFDEQNIDDFDF